MDLAASLFCGALRIVEAPNAEIKPAATIRPTKLLCIIVFSRPFNLDFTKNPSVRSQVVKCIYHSADCKRVTETDCSDPYRQTRRASLCLIHTVGKGAPMGCTSNTSRALLGTA